MSKQLSYQIFNLIKRLTKAEKRNFKLYAKRNSAEKEPVIVRLFDVYDRLDVYDEKKISGAFPDLRSNTISNHRSHLYEQLLTSLRLLQRDQPAVRIKELMSYSEVLHAKGLYQESLSQLAKAKALAARHKMDVLRLEIVEFEKKIETRYVTGSYPERAKELTEESTDLRHQLYFEGAWSDLALQLYDYYLKYGHVRNKEQYELVVAFFEDTKPKHAIGHQSLFYFQCFVWFHHIIQSFPQCYRYAKGWCALFESSEEMMSEEPEMYIRGFHNVLSSLFFCDDVKRYRVELERLESFVSARIDRFNDNQQIQSFIYLQTGRLNQFFLEGKFTEGAAYCQQFEADLQQYEDRIDIHRLLVFQYKMASLKFGSGDFNGSLRHLNRIINHPTSSLKEDIQSYARFLSLIVHYELGNDDLLFFQIKSTYRFMLKLRDFQKVHAAIFGFLRKSIYVDRKKLVPLFSALREELTEVVKDKYERRPMLYLDIISWLESKIEGVSVEKVIRNKKLAKGA